MRLPFHTDAGNICLAHRRPSLTPSDESRAVGAVERRGRSGAHELDKRVGTQGQEAAGLFVEGVAHHVFARGGTGDARVVTVAKPDVVLARHHPRPQPPRAVAALEVRGGHHALPVLPGFAVSEAALH